jgi:hypothetical protein
MESRESPDRFASRLFLHDSLLGSPPQGPPETAQPLAAQAIELPDTRFKRVIRDQILLEHLSIMLPTKFPNALRSRRV